MSSSATTWTPARCLPGSSLDTDPPEPTSALVCTRTTMGFTRIVLLEGDSYTYWMTDPPGATLTRTLTRLYIRSPSGSKTSQIGSTSGPEC